MLKELHDNHLGSIIHTKVLDRSYVWRPGMNKFIKEKAQYCHSFKVHQKMSATASIHPWESAKTPWVRVYLDFAGPFVGKMF